MAMTAARVTIRGVRIRASWTWLAVASLVALITAESLSPEIDSAPEALRWYGTAALMLLLVVMSVLAHDLAHVVAARRSSSRIAVIEPALFGALHESALWTDRPGVEARVVAAGPALSLALGLALLAAGWALGAGSVEPFAGVLTFLGLVNVGFGTLNLLPGYPLDGGRLLRAFVWYLSDNRIVGTRVAAFYGQVIFTAAFVGGFVIVALGEPYAVWGAWALLVVWSASRAGREGVARTMWSEVGKNITINDIGLTSGVRVDDAQSIDQVLDDLLQAAQDGMLLVEQDGQVTGVVSMALLRKVPRGDWGTRPLRDVTVSIEGLPRVNADLTVDELFRVFDDAGDDVVLVESRGRVVSAVIRRSAIRRLQERLTTQRRPPPPAPP